MKTAAIYTHRPWNKGKLVGQKAPLRLRDIWAIRVRLQITEKSRDLALFNLAIDSKLRACDLTKLRCTGRSPRRACVVMSDRDAAENSTSGAI
ncbi:hypothetical protein PS910_03823 [Pseudomonas fluorescens]|nr:hypothetical protein PS910_03823 [Pseudomonas fluorescens]